MLVQTLFTSQILSLWLDSTPELRVSGCSMPSRGFSCVLLRGTVTPHGQGGPCPCSPQRGRWDYPPGC